jgi:hypothetical protein
MKKYCPKAFKTFFNFKKSLRIVYIILMIIAIYYSVITGFFLLFLLPLIAMWLTGTEGVEFFNVSNSQKIQRTDVSYFTRGDILECINLLIIIAILVLVIFILRKIEKKLP